MLSNNIYFVIYPRGWQETIGIYPLKRAYRLPAVLAAKNRIITFKIKKYIFFFVFANPIRDPGAGRENLSAPLGCRCGAATGSCHGSPAGFPVRSPRIVLFFRHLRAGSRIWYRMRAPPAVCRRPRSISSSRFAPVRANSSFPAAGSCSTRSSRIVHLPGPGVAGGDGSGDYAERRMKRREIVLRGGTLDIASSISGGTIFFRWCKRGVEGGGRSLHLEV